MSVPTGDPELDMLLAEAVEAYYSGDSSDISDALRDLLIHYGALTTDGDRASYDGA